MYNGIREVWSDYYAKRTFKLSMYVTTKDTRASENMKKALGGMLERYLSAMSRGFCCYDDE